MKDFKDLRDLRSIQPFLLRTLILFGAGLLIFTAGRVHAQSAGPGPLPATQPSDQPPTEPTGSSAGGSPTRSMPQVAGKPNLAGEWKLNSDDSDDPRQKMQQAGGDFGGPGGSGGRGGGGMGGPGGGGGFPGGRGGWGGTGGQQGGNPQGGDQQTGEEQERGPGRGGMMRDFFHLTIEQSAASAKVTGSSGRVLAIYSSDSLDQANSKTSSGNERNAPSVAQWQANQLVAVEQMRNGTTTRTYELSPNSQRLYVTTKIENKRFKQPVSYRFVYDADQVKMPGK